MLCLEAGYTPEQVWNLTPRQFHALMESVHRKQAGEHLMALAIARGDVKELEKMQQSWVDVLRGPQPEPTDADRIEAMATMAPPVQAKKMRSHAKALRLLASLKEARA